VLRGGHRVLWGKRKGKREKKEGGKGRNEIPRPFHPVRPMPLSFLSTGKNSKALVNEFRDYIFSKKEKKRGGKVDFVVYPYFKLSSFSTPEKLAKTLYQKSQRKGKKKKREKKKGGEMRKHAEGIAARYFPCCLSCLCRGR